MAALEPVELTLTVTPSRRFQAIDVAARVREVLGESTGRFARACYCSHHTTAGFLEQSLSQRLEGGVERFVSAFRELFPAGAGYRHDVLDERQELSPAQRECEPRNADSHLAFIGAGLSNCVTYANRPGRPVYLVELDGLHGETPRTRNASVLLFSRARAVARERIEVAVSRHPIDAVNLAGSRLGLLERAEAMAAAHGVRRGRLDVALEPGEREVGLTVNEYETLLMRHDLAEVLHDPLRFAARQARHLFADLRALPAKGRGYARYDAVIVLKAVMDSLGIGESALERLLARVMAVPAARFLRMKRSVSLLLSDGGGSGTARVVRGVYQNPILIQWASAPHRRRTLDLTLTSFE